MTRLRKAAKEKLFAAYKVIARNPRNVSEKTVARGMKYLHADDLRSVIEWDPIRITNLTKELSPLDTLADSYHAQLAEYFPTSIDDIEGDDHNPGWYHR